MWLVHAFRGTFVVFITEFQAIIIIIIINNIINVSLLNIRVYDNLAL